jgi:hypothetical protein
MLKKSSINTVNLTDNGYLKQSRLNDGEEGYVLGDTLVYEVVSVLNKYIDGEVFSVKIEDFSKVYDFDTKIIRHISSLGGNVVSVDKSTQEQFYDCTVRAKVTSLLKLVSNSLDCEGLSDESIQNYDLVVTYGKKYYERY